MKSINVPASGQQVSCVGFSNNYTTAGKLPDEVRGYVRIKNVGEDYGHIRIYGNQDAGMAFSPGETEYIYVNSEDNLEIVDGEFNIMF